MRAFILFAAAAAFTRSQAVPVAGSEQECADPPARIEWRELDPANQKGYIDAVLCLKTKPSRIGLDTPLYDDFPHVHFTLAQVSKLNSTYRTAFQPRLMTQSSTWLCGVSALAQVLHPRLLRSPPDGVWLYWPFPVGCPMSPVVGVY